MPTPLVSLITRTFNRADLLFEAYQSIAAQTYTHIEWIIVNDGGEQPDQTQLLAAGAISHIQIVHLADNQGRSAAAQAGLDAATGEFVGFLDDDDLLYPNHVTLLVTALQADPTIALAYAGVHVQHYDDAKRLLRQDTLSEPYYANRLFIQNYIPNFALLFRARLKSSIHFDKTLTVYEDWDFLLQLSQLTPFSSLKEITGIYRNFGGSGLTETSATTHRQSRQYLYQKWLPYYPLDGIMDYAISTNNPWTQAAVSHAQALLESNHSMQLQTITDAYDEQSKQIGLLNQHIEQQKGLITQQSEALSQQNQDLSHTHFQLAQLQTQLQATLNSRSWRITAPLRCVGMAVRQGLLFLLQVRRLLQKEGGGLTGIIHIAGKIQRAYRQYGLKATYLHCLRIARGLAAQPYVTADSALPINTTAVSCHKPIIRPPLTVDIIVCVHNALEDVQRCLDSVLQHSSHPYRIIIVDDGSQDATRDFLSHFAQSHTDILLLRNEQAQGYTLAANIGLLASTADAVVLLNSDTLVSDEWLDRLLTCLISDERLMMVGPLSNTASWQSVPEIEYQGDWADNPLPDGVSIDQMADAIATQSARLYPRLGFLNGFCLMIKRSTIMQIGVFDEQTFAKGYGEENDYSLRIDQAGGTLAVADDVYVYHAQSKSYSHERRKILGEQAGIKLAQKHGQTRIDQQVDLCRYHPVMQGIRERAAIALERANTQLLIRQHRAQHQRIAFILPAATAGGGSNIIVSEAQVLRACGIDVCLINLHQHQTDFETAYPNLSLPVRYIEKPEQLPTVIDDRDIVIASIYYTVGWMDAVREHFPDIQWAYYIQDFEPYFFTANSADYHHALASYSLIPDLKRFCKTQWNADEVLSQTGQTCAVIGASLDVDRFRPRSDQVRTIPRILAMIRPYSAHRSARLTLDVLRHVQQHYASHCEIVTFGTGADDPDFLALPIQFPFQHLGRLTPAQLANVMSEVDIFVDFSTYQAMGLTALEAMACGVAVIIPQAGGASSFATHMHNALMVDTCDQAACIAALSQLIDDSTLRQQLAQHAQHDAAQHYPEKAALALLEVISPP